MIEDLITQLEVINQMDSGINSVMDLSMIGIMQNQVEKITLIDNISDNRIKAIVCCDAASRKLHFPEPSGSNNADFFSHHKQSKEQVHFTRVYLKITKYIWNGFTDHMESHGFNKRPIAKAIINTINNIQNRFQQRKIRSLQDQVVSHFKKCLVAEKEFSVPGSWSSSKASYDKQNEDTSNSIGWIKMKISNK